MGNQNAGEQRNELEDDERHGDPRDRHACGVLRSDESRREDQAGAQRNRYDRECRHDESESRREPEAPAGRTSGGADQERNAGRECHQQESDRDEVIEATVRLLPGVLGNASSTHEESHSPGNDGLLEYPQYTRPAEFRGEGVPPELVSGNHAEIAKWRAAQARSRTAKRRPDLLEKKK